METVQLLVVLAVLAALAAASSNEAEDLRSALADPLFRHSLADRWTNILRTLHDIEKNVPCAASFRSNASLFMLDASAKDAPGLLAGSWFHLGNWDECVGLRDQVDQAGNTFHGQMCMLDLGAAIRTPAADRRRLQALARENPGALPADAALLNTISLKMAACVPSTCGADDVQKLFQLLFDDLLSTEAYNLTVSVDPITCTTKDTPNLDASDWVAVALYIVLALLVVTSTAVDLVVPNRRPLLAAFSVYSNGKKLLAVSGGGDGAISCLHGIRFLSMAWVVLGHRYLAHMSMPNINPAFLLDFINSWWRIGLTNATLSVDTFFMLSGLLVGYLFFKQMRGAGSRRFNLPMYYIHRYVRLTPALAVMCLLQSTLLIRMGWGPVWESSLTDSRDNCQGGWWSVLLYLNNYISPSKSCVGQSWYLMVDMQLYWLSPLLLFPMLWWRRIGLAFYSLLCAGGLATCFAISYVKDLPTNMLEIMTNPSDGDTIMFWFRRFYIPAYTRFLPYLIGLGLGYVLADIRVKAKKVKFSIAMSVVLWLTAAAFLLVPLFCDLPFLKSDMTTTKLQAAFYNSLSRPAWAFGVALVVFICSTGHGWYINTFLSWKGFQLLSRVSYCVFLVHMSVQNIEVASVRTNTYLSDMVMLPAFASDLLISYLLGAVLSVVAESPFMVLEKELFGGRTGRQAAPQTQQRMVAETSSKDSGPMRV